MTQSSAKPAVWTGRDSALWETCEIAVDLARGVNPSPRADIVSSFPPQLARDERFWAAGPFLLSEVHPFGDGTYRHNGGFFFATGRGGLTMTAAVAALRATGARVLRVANATS